MKTFVASLLLLFSTFTLASTPVILQDTELRDFVTWYTKQTGQGVIISPGIKTTLTVYAPDVTPDALPDLFAAVIRSHGLDLQPGNPLVITQPDHSLQSADQDESLPLVTRVHVFRHVLADDLLDFSTSFVQLQRDGKQASKSPAVYVIRSLNALALTTTEDQHAVYDDLLPLLDNPRPLIHLESIIYETSDSSGLDLGLSYGQSTRSDSGALSGFNLSGLSQMPGTGGSFGIFDGDYLTFVLNALQSDLAGKILSTPQILVLSGEQGVISVGQNVPFLTSVTTGTSQTTQGIERRDVGVSLSVRPFVSQQGQIILNISLTADTINQSLQATDIITNTRNLTTTVRIQAGQSITLGGLITEDQEETVKSVPLLGSIPILGVLFRSTSTSTHRRELNIVLRASEITGARPAQLTPRSGGG
ncbi:MAG: hypothetical protein IBX50_12670 [Marinospirillum sp.]|uniref:hypothetical protein n=1 Tax=Marinospirillum sp. TaxID=2183934 RepID=UPI001A0C83FF|nr:hypothetical protein [Marinospirillum sp.]MBE0507548.1 hypothetical protein [Marinospirillum sp.]